MSPSQRAPLGLGRTFQAATLFPELTVRETIQVALEARKRSSFVLSALFLDGRAERRQRSEADELISFLGLGRYADSFISDLSTGTRRIVELAGLLAVDAKVLCLDEPTAGVDVELRQSMWAVVEELRKDGVTIILTTHYIEEAEAIADRIAVIAKGSIRLVEEKAALMKRLGQKSLTLELQNRMGQVPEGLSEFRVVLSDDGTQLIYKYDTQAERTGIARLMTALGEQGVVLKDLQTNQSSLEDIFVNLLKEGQQ